MTIARRKAGHRIRLTGLKTKDLIALQTRFYFMPVGRF
jgi:hypothetical protein